MLRVILRNLLSNALTHTSSGGTVILTLTVQESFIKMSVADTGKGMSSEILSSLFQENTALASRSRGQGVGIGLALCRALVDAHQGTLEIESEPGKGTTVTVTLNKGEPL